MLSVIRRRVGQFAVGRVAMVARMALAPVALGATALLIDRDGKVGLVRHSYSEGLSLPGGGVGRGEPPQTAILRELQEELGTVRADPPAFFGLYTRPAGWVTNLVVLYRLMNCEVEFRPSLEVRELVFVDPRDLPPGVLRGTRRRLAEHCGAAPIDPFW
ncbi:MAG TPA: NUDIX domain-containing protein [Rhizomicrobium sp.]